MIVYVLMRASQICKNTSQLPASVSTIITNYELNKKRVGGSISVSFQTPTQLFATEVNRNVYRRCPLFEG